MTPFKLHIIFGLSLLLIGIIFDFLFVQGKIGQELVRVNPPSLTSWAKELYSLSAFYMLVFGFLNITLALLIRHLEPATNLDWVILVLIFAGSILIIATGIWYANAGPSFEWETRCTVLTIGLIFAVLGIGMEIYRFFTLKNF